MSRLFAPFTALCFILLGKYITAFARFLFEGVSCFNEACCPAKFVCAALEVKAQSVFHLLFYCMCTTFAKTGIACA